MEVRDLFRVLGVISLSPVLANLFGVTRHRSPNHNSRDRTHPVRITFEKSKALAQDSRRRQKKAPRISCGALLCSAENTLINNFDKIRIARADHPLRIYKAVNVNRDPAAIHEREVRIPDQPEMSVPESLDEELLRMPS